MSDDEFDNTEEACQRTFGLVRSITSRFAKKCVGKSAESPRLGAFLPDLWTPREDAPTSDNRIYLASHRQNREKDAAMKDAVRTGIKLNRFCKMLTDEDLDTISEQMEYFSFAAGEHVVRQGNVGFYFFVVQDGLFDVVVDGKIANELTAGTAFGAIALLYACPRTATVIAKEAGSVWGVDAATFRQVMLSAASSHQEDNHRFLDSISLFDGLAADQKERVGKLAILSSHFPAGHRVVTEGEIAGAMYFVKKGELSVYVGGSIAPDRNASKQTCEKNDVSTSVRPQSQLVGAEKIAELRAGERFGERPLLYNELWSSTVIADCECELLCIGASQLREVLGKDLIVCLERTLLLSVFSKMPMFSHLSSTQQNEMVQAFEFKTCQACESVQSDDQEGMQLAIVIDGEMNGTDSQGDLVTINRGEWCGEDAFGKASSDSRINNGTDSTGSINDFAQRKMSKSKPIVTKDLQALQGSGCSSINSMVAGPSGARVALLSTEALVNAMQVLGLTAIGGSEEALDYMRQVLCAKKVPIFRGLSQEQINDFVGSFVLKRYNAGAVVIKQGEVGTEFFIISNGSVNITIDGSIVRNLGKNSCFGERALLFDEPRSASVEAAEDGTALWSIGKAAFNEVVSENMRQELEYRIKLQDTSVSLKLIYHVRIIGAGAFGSVRLVEHKYTGLKYALKRIKKIDGEVPEEVVTECNLLAGMDHPFILQLVKTFYTQSSIYILTELITGGQLHEQLQRMGVLTRKQAQFYVASLVLILEHLHEKLIVYRDLKPENVMLDPQGFLKLVDFGLAKKIDSGKTYTFGGTIYYMAPEVIEGHGYTISVDIWSLGVMFYEFVCGCLPFGEGLDDESEILASVMGDDLRFPSKYNDNAGKNLMKGLMDRDPVSRMGAGINGFADIKTNKYFKVGVSGNIFSKIMGRELEAPVVPGQDQFSDLRKLEATISLSDADELGEA